MNNSFIQVGIPIAILKFMEFRVINSKEYRQKWDANVRNILRSEIFNLNPKIAKTLENFKKYFENLIDLKPHRKVDSFNGGNSLGGLIHSFQLNQDFLLKITVQPEKKAYFKISPAYEENYKINIDFNNLVKMEEFLIQTLVFLFKDD